METWREEARSDELMHYGVKGMKWKKRRARGNASDYNTPTGYRTDDPRDGYIAGTRKVQARTTGRGARYNHGSAKEISTDMRYESNPRDKWYRWAKRRRNQRLQTAARLRRSDWGKNLKYKNPTKGSKMYRNRAAY